jgi:putative hydrolase of the HAD superfamily
MINYLIFDLDNTIYPSTALINQQIPQRMIGFVSKFLNIPFEQAKILRSQRLPHFGSTLEWLSTEHNLTNYNDFLSVVHPEDEINELPKIEGLRELFTSIDLPKVILTNSPKFHAQRVLKFYNIEDCFSNIYGIVENQLKGKPHPRSYKNILEKENFKLEETLFFDDHPKYVKGFLDIGGKPVLVDKNLEFQDQPFLSTGKVKTIRTIFEIPELLKEY